MFPGHGSSICLQNKLSLISLKQKDRAEDEVKTGERRGKQEGKKEGGR